MFLLALLTVILCTSCVETNTPSKDPEIMEPLSPNPQHDKEPPSPPPRDDKTPFTPKKPNKPTPERAKLEQELAVGQQKLDNLLNSYRGKKRVEDLLKRAEEIYRQLNQNNLNDDEIDRISSELLMLTMNDVVSIEAPLLTPIRSKIDKLSYATEYTFPANELAAIPKEGIARLLAKSSRTTEEDDFLQTLELLRINSSQVFDQTSLETYARSIKSTISVDRVTQRVDAILNNFENLKLKERKEAAFELVELHKDNLKKIKDAEAQQKALQDALGAL